MPFTALPADGFSSRMMEAMSMMTGVDDKMAYRRHVSHAFIYKCAAATHTQNILSFSIKSYIIYIIYRIVLTVLSGDIRLSSLLTEREAKQHMHEWPRSNEIENTHVAGAHVRETACRKCHLGSNSAVQYKAELREIERG